MTKTFFIGDRRVGEGEPTFIIAEVSCNHQQDYAQAEAIVRAAARAGADAVKIQTYTPDTMTIDSDKPWFRVDGDANPDNWKGKTFYQLYQEAYTPWDWDEKLQKLAAELGLIFFSTPFDPTAVDFLETLNVPCYKIAAYESTDIPLLRAVAKKGKPVIISVGFATLPEIEYSLKTLRDAGAKDITVLHCTTSYQNTEAANTAHLRTMLDIKDRFDVVVGFSDNMGGIEVPVLSAAMGAAVIEKHLVLKHDTAILDDQFSLDVAEFTEMVRRLRAQEVAMGKVAYGPRTKEEEHNKRFRRSLFVVKNIKKGELFTEDNIRSIRPALGLETKHIDEVLGRTASEDIERGTPLSWELVNR
jgi:pseudaminic acid synthase